MTSTRKVAASRRNAARSTGPKTPGGKARASHNAYKHGLAINVLSDPAISAEVDRLARSIIGKRREPYELAQARIVAEAEFDVLRIRAMRVKMIDSAAKSSSDPSLAEEPVSEAHGVAAHLGALPQLETLERYERRAISRRGRAIRQMYKSSM